MEIQVYNTSLELEGVLDSFNTFSFTQKYNKKGTFTIKAELTETAKELLKVDNIIYYDGKSGFIESVQYTIENTQTIVATGATLDYYLNRRIIWNTIDFSGTAEAFIRKAVDENSITTDTNRKIPFLSLDTSAGTTPTVEKQVSYKNLYSTISEVALEADLGFDIVFTPTAKNLKFKVYDGAETGLVFSRDYDNILSLDYVDSKKDYLNVVKVGGKGEGTARVFATVGSGTGLQRYEGFLDATNLDTTAQLTQKGNEKLAESYRIKTFDGVVNSKVVSSFPLGGKVCFLDLELGLSLTTRITEIEEIYEAKGKTTNLTFGYNVPSIYEKMGGR